MVFEVFEKEIPASLVDDEVAISTDKIYEIYRSDSQYIIFNCIGFIHFYVDKETKLPVEVRCPSMGSAFKTFKKSELDQMFQMWIDYKNI